MLVTLAAELAKHKLDHPPLTLLFSVREESGLWGARHVDPNDLGPVKMAFNFDGRGASDVVIGAVGADRWEVEIFGRASHAGGAPERGISATMIMSLALADVQAGGWFGKVVKGDKQGTSNVGPVTGGDGRPAGDATNVVTDYVHVRGESRSHDAKFFKEITAAYKAAFETAAAQVTNSEGKSGKVKFTTHTDYHPFRLKETLPVVKRAIAAVAADGAKPNVRVDQRRARRQLDGAARHPDGDVRRRPERGAHRRRVGRPRRVRRGLPAGGAACDDGVSGR